MDEDEWLWCLRCERFFQAKDLAPDITGGKEGCVFEECDGAGLGIDVYYWDEWPNNNPVLWEHWPKFSDLKKGLRCPLYP